MKAARIETIDMPEINPAVVSNGAMSNTVTSRHRIWNVKMKYLSVAQYDSIESSFAAELFKHLGIFLKHEHPLMHDKIKVGNRIKDRQQTKTIEFCPKAV